LFCTAASKPAPVTVTSAPAGAWRGERSAIETGGRGSVVNVLL
jgi:hypothetical protein